MFHTLAGEEKRKMHPVEPAYYGPPQPGQTFGQYQAMMELPVAAGGAVVGALLFGPIGAIIGGAGAWFAASKSRPKI